MGYMLSCGRNKKTSSTWLYTLTEKIVLFLRSSLIYICTVNIQTKSTKIGISLFYVENQAKWRSWRWGRAHHNFPACARYTPPISIIQVGLSSLKPPWQSVRKFCLCLPPVCLGVDLKNSIDSSSTSAADRFPWGLRGPVRPSAALFPHRGCS